MPHLSPMKWTLVLSSLWLTQFIIQSSTWWDNPTSFSSPSTANKNHNNLTSWKWLRDGR